MIWMAKHKILSYLISLLVILIASILFVKGFKTWLALIPPTFTGVILIAVVWDTIDEGKDELMQGRCRKQ
jgi:CHASE2 domain-containing sensor protein